MFLLWLRQLPRCGDRTPASVPPPTEGRSNATNTPTFCPSSFIVPSFAWVYIFFSTGQVLLAPSAGVLYTFASEDVFLMYPWREMGSTSTYSSAILFSSKLFSKSFHLDIPQYMQNWTCSSFHAHPCYFTKPAFSPLFCVLMNSRPFL